MGTGYTRADTANNIADGNIINASDLDSEYDAIQSAFNASTGHTHDGTAGEGAPIETIGPSQDVVATASVLRPKTDNTVDLGTTSLEYKDLFLDGTAHIDTLDVDENASITGTLGVTGATTLSSTLGVTGATTLSSTLGVTGATTLSSTLGVTGAATLSSTLAVTGATGIDGDFDINTNKFTVASATGNTAVAGTLGVTGATTLSSTLGVTGESTLASAIVSDLTSGRVVLAGTSGALEDSGNLTFDGSTLAVTGAATVSTTLGVTGATTATGGLNVDTISEITSANGVVIDGVTLKDGGATVTADITFGDNDKVIFGAGSDLQIYHDGSNSYIKDAGTGDLILRASTGIKLQSGSGALEYLSTNSSTGSVELKLSGSTKLATTSTGIDVTGTVTADGLTVDTSSGDLANFSFSRASGSANLKISSPEINRIDFDASTTSDSMSFSTSGTERARIANNGDISFYEDTGTTPKFFWDASAERLGIGTTSPAATLHSYMPSGNTENRIETGAGASYLRLKANTQANAAYNGIYSDYGSTNDWFISGGQSSSNEIKFGIANSTKITIDSSGNVGIGTSSPSRQLSLYGSAPYMAFQNATTGATTGDGLQIQMAGNDAYIWNYENSFMAFGTNNTERMRIDSSGNLLVGTTTNYTKLTVSNGAATRSGITISDTTSASLMMFAGASDNAVIGTDANSLVIRRGMSVGTDNGTETARFDSSGNLLVGHTTVDSFTNVGHQLDADGYAIHTRTSAPSLYVGRKTTDGSIMEFNKDGTTVGSIGVGGSTAQPIIGSGNTGSGGTAAGLRFDRANNAIEPWNVVTNAAADNIIDLGFSSIRFDDIYATNGTIQTSDRNEKQDIAELSDAEQRVAVAAKGLLRKFRWKDAVAEKGDEARTHFGIIAQDLQAAFAAEGLDAGDYAMFISSTWTDEETGEERTRMGVRYSELLAFIIAAI